MKNISILFVSIFILLSGVLNAHINPETIAKYKQEAENLSDELSLREDCQPSESSVDLNINNVRARLQTGGDMWWDFQDGKYIVPNPPIGSNIPEVASIFAGGVWIGGEDPNGNLKLAATTYRAGGNTDYYAGPIDPDQGTTDLEICNNWDRFFTVNGVEVKKIIADYDVSQIEEEEYPCDSIPEGVRYWPGKGNPYFLERYPFELPNTGQGLGSFWDDDGDGLYDPCRGDFPIIEIRGCEPENREEASELVPDQMIFWIYNDAGGEHRLSMGDKIQMEVQVQSFAYGTNDEVNDMTFYRYKLINRAKDDIRDCYFAKWVDPDLGCPTDDYIGCDVGRSLAYVYNEDQLDGDNGINCDGGIATYQDKVPYLGIDYFRGPLGPKNYVISPTGDTTLVNPPPGEAEFDVLEELGMSSFVYTNRGDISPEPQTSDPNLAIEFYRLLQGQWIDGTAITAGGSGFNPGSVDSIRYVFPGDPDDPDSWSMCSESLPFGDRRTIQASGPFLLKPAAVNELIVGVVWVPDVEYPCPSIERLQSADDLAQALFDNCFDIIDGPDAPDICPIELDREIILVLSNDSVQSNNKFEEYSENDILASENIVGDDRLYFFEGYKIYQLANALVTPQEFDDIEKARQIRQVDVKNGVGEIYNWSSEIDPNPASGGQVWSFERVADGGDNGIAHTFRVTTDAFASGDNRLVNHKTYYFTALAYGYNNYETFDPTLGEGQRTPYLEGRNNVETYAVTPRPIVYETLNAQYGDGAVITRIDGVGVGGNFLDMDESMNEKILDGSFDGRILYKDGAGPIAVKVYDPLEVKDGKYTLEIIGENVGGELCALKNGATWRMTDLQTGAVTESEQSIDVLNEQLLPQYGFSLSIEQSSEPGDNVNNNGLIDIVAEYEDASGSAWYGAVQDDARNMEVPSFISSAFNFLKTNPGEVDNDFDLSQSYSSSLQNSLFYPFYLTSGDPSDNANLPFFITPAWKDASRHGFIRNGNGLKNLNNVDIIFTSDKSKWSRCIVVETANEDYQLNLSQSTGEQTIGGAKMLDLRESPSVDKDGNPDGEGNGLSWFPGYAVDVETGKRLNIFFGENSLFNESIAENLDNNVALGTDMLFNPTSQLLGGGFNQQDFRQFVVGGNHFIYVTREEYDGCAAIAGKMSSLSGKIDALKAVTWTSMSILPAGQSMLSYADGAIPNDLTVKCRVDNRYGLEQTFNINLPTGCNPVGESPKYEFEIRNKQSQDLTSEEYEGALANINVVPNPYYGYSSYEQGPTTKFVKITNLPDRANVTIFSLDGKFIRQFRRDLSPTVKSGPNPGTLSSQTTPDVTWDLNNYTGIPVASGVYLIHIEAQDLGEERTIKWFGVNRKFDPSGL